MIQNNGFLKTADFFLVATSSPWFMKSTAKIGFMMNATISEAVSVKISITGR